MKKITFLAAALLVSATMSAQIVLSHSTDNTVFESGSVACASDPDDTPGTGDEGSSDNIFYRAYTPADFDVESNGFEIQGANFFISFGDVGGSDPTVEFNVRFFSSDDVFPSGTLTELASQTVEATAADDGSLFEVTLDEPFTVNASEEVIVAVDFAAASPVPDNYDIRIGINSLGEAEPGYLTSAGCDIADPVTPDAIGFPDNHIILDIVGDEAELSLNDHLLSQVAVYPNPAVDVINVNVPSGVQIESATLVDVLGKNTGATISNGTINVSELAKGIYMLSVKTTAGTLTQKVVKK